MTPKDTLRRYEKIKKRLHGSKTRTTFTSSSTRYSNLPDKPASYPISLETTSLFSSCNSCLFLLRFFYPLESLLFQ